MLTAKSQKAVHDLSTYIPCKRYPTILISSPQYLIIGVESILCQAPSTVQIAQVGKSCTWDTSPQSSYHLCVTEITETFPNGSKRLNRSHLGLVIKKIYVHYCLHVHAMWGRTHGRYYVWRNTRDELSHWVAHHSQKIEMVVRFRRVSVRLSDVKQ